MVRNLLLLIVTVATVALIAPCFEMDWISELSRVKWEMPEMTDFWDKELMLHRKKVREPMIVLLETSSKVILFMNKPEKALAFTLSILLFLIVIELNEDGNTFGDSEGEDMLTNLRLIVGSSVGTFSLKALCSKTSSTTFSALKLRRPAKALGLMTVLRE